MPTTTRTYASNRIRELRVERGLTQSDLAALVGEDLSNTTIAKLENRQMGLTLDWMIAIAKALNMLPEDLIGGRRPRHLPVAGRIVDGKWREAIQNPEGWVYVDEGKGGLMAFALRPEGDSMDKVIREGGFIVVDPDQFDLIDGKIYAVDTGQGEPSFKMYRASPAGLEPCSTNPEHRPIAIGREPFTVIGRVTFAGFDT